MGYTHYWQQARDFTDTEWAELTATAQRVIKSCGVPLLFESDQIKPPQIDGERIRFNGVTRDGHETFVMTRKKRARRDYEAESSDPDDAENAPRFEFCKTAAKPYDVAVVAILIAASSIGGMKDSNYPAVSWSSDGETADHDAGRRLLIEVTTAAVQPLALGDT